MQFFVISLERRVRLKRPKLIAMILISAREGPRNNIQSIAAL
jgi:hypothetical protein